ncbi:MAG: glycosyltransferase family 4 protein [Anaeromyxobacteraceae bacterium]
MKVGIFTPYDLSHEGGVNRHARALASALARSGHAALVVGPASGAVPEGCEGIRGVVPIPANGSVARIGLFASRRAVARILEREGFDLLHVHEPLVPGPARIALRLAKVPVVATFHANSEREVPLQALARRIGALGLSRIAHGIAVSREAKRFSRAIYRGRTAVIPNGVDLVHYARAIRAGDHAAPASGALKVLFVGRFGEERKGLPVLLDACARLVASGRPVALAVAGEGPRERFEGAARRANARFLGRVADGEILDALAECDVFCAPSLHGESFGMVVVEAMAAGCPVVASDIPGYAEAARGAAILVPPGRPEALAEALWRVWQDGPLRARLAQHGVARAQALDWSRVAEHVLRIYRRAGVRE